MHSIKLRSLLRTTKKAPDETLIFNDGTRDWAIPPGTPVSMSSALIHHDKSIFPQSKKFRPERWIEHLYLDRYLVSFSKETGMNLAYAELFVAISKIFRAYGSKEVRGEDDVGYLELFETTEDDMRIVKDLFIPLVKEGSKGVRIVVKE